MKMYSKPMFYVEEFIAAHAVASCNTDFVSSTIKVEEQPILCGRQNETTDNVFNAASSCSMYAIDAGYLSVGKTYSKFEDFISDIVNSTATGNKTGSITKNGNSWTVTEGFYAVWTDDDDLADGYKIDHAGVANSTVIDMYTSSY